MKKLTATLLFFAVVANAQTPQLYTEIAFLGAERFSAQALGAVLGIEEKSVFFWKKQREYTKEEIEDFKDDLKEFYDSKGFFNAEISIKLSDKKAVFTIREGKRIDVASVSIKSPYDIEKYVHLKKGLGFDADAFISSKESIRRYLGENGYPKAKFDAKAYIDLEKYEARAEFNVSEAPRSNFGKIRASSLENISEESVKNRLSFKSGDRYDIRKIDESYKNLYATGAFESVSIKPLLDSNGDDAPVDVNLTLGKLKSFKMGLGYDTDEGVRLKGGWLHRNFLGELKKLELMTEISGVKQTAGAELKAPFILGLEFNNLLKYEKARYSGYHEQTLSNSFKFSFPYKTTTHGFGVLTEVGDVDVDSQSEQLKNDSFFINSLFYEYAIDKRDSYLDAKNGYFIAWNVEFADNLIGSTVNYLKTNIEARRIFSFKEESPFKNFVFAAKANVGAINDFRKNYIPVFKRYFAGGSFSNRGYQYRRVGKQDASGAYIGGNSLIDYSLEARYKGGKSLWGVVFLDSTLLNEKSFAFNGEYKPSIGLGARYDTIIGPVRLDIGVPLREKDKSPAFHISFGQAF